MTVQVQPSEWKRPHLNVVGKMLNVFKLRGVPKQILKPEYGPPESRLMYRPAGKRAQILATFTEKVGWKIFVDALQEVVGSQEVRAEEILQEYHALS